MFLHPNMTKEAGVVTIQSNQRKKGKNYSIQAIRMASKSTILLLKVKLSNFNPTTHQRMDIILMKCQSRKMYQLIFLNKCLQTAKYQK